MDYAGKLTDEQFARAKPRMLANNVIPGWKTALSIHVKNMQHALIQCPVTCAFVPMEWQVKHVTGKYLPVSAVLAILAPVKNLTTPMVIGKYTLQNTKGGMGNQKCASIETGNIWYTRRRKTKQKHNTICVLDTIMRKQTQII
jgi:hypothetical protein